MKDEFNFSVLMSVYIKENFLFLKQSLESIYDGQTLKPTEIVLVEDGKLTSELYEVIEEFKKKNKGILKSVRLENNLGLGNALREGVKNCKYNWIARMDTDDIAFPERFQKQINYLKKNRNVDILGSYMYEFIGTTNNIICMKKAYNHEKDHLKNYIKMRTPVNHPSVLIRKSKLIEAGNYEEILFNEDTYLWGKMFVKGAIFKNIQEPLVYFRVNDETYKRRGGWKYIKSEYEIQKKFLELEITNYFDFIRAIFLKSLIFLLPNKVRKVFYLNVLRKI